MENKTNKLAIASLVLGIISIVFVPTIVVSIVCGILAIVFGVKGKNNVNDTDQSNKGLGIGGIITGAVGIFGSVLMSLVIICGLTLPFLSSRAERFKTNFEKVMKENFDSNFSWDDANDIEDNGEKVEVKIPTTEGKNNNTKELFEKGYENNMHSISNNVYQTLFIKGDSYIVAKAKLTDEQYTIYESISLADDDYDGEMKAFIISLDDVTLKDISDKVPTQKDLDKYIGSTLGDLEKAEFEQTGTSLDENGDLIFTYSNGTYNISVSLDDSIVVEDLDDLSENDIRAFKVDKITFNGFDFGIFEE